jgi:hypothetical protein
MMRHHWPALLLSSLILALGCPGLLPAQKGKPKTTRNPLLGKWQLVAVESPEVVYEGERFAEKPRFTGKPLIKQGKRLMFDRWTFKENVVVKENVFGPDPPVPYRRVKGGGGIDFATIRFVPQPQKQGFAPSVLPYIGLLTTGIASPQRGGPGEIEDFEQPQMGIYRVEGNELTLCVHNFLPGAILVGQNGEQTPHRPTRPSDLKASWNDKQGSFIVFRLRRLPAAGKAAPRPQTPPEGDAIVIAKNPKLLALARQKYEAVREEMDGRMKIIAIGKGYPDKFLIETCERLLRSEMDLAKSREEQIDALERHWGRVCMVEDYEQTKYEVGKEDITVFAPVRRLRLELELKIERMRNQPPKK